MNLSANRIIKPTNRTDLHHRFQLGNSGQLSIRQLAPERRPSSIPQQSRTNSRRRMQTAVPRAPQTCQQGRATDRQGTCDQAATLRCASEIKLAGIRATVRVETYLDVIRNKERGRAMLSTGWHREVDAGRRRRCIQRRRQWSERAGRWRYERSRKQRFETPSARPEYGIT